MRELVTNVISKHRLILPGSPKSANPTWDTFGGFGLSFYILLGFR